MIAGLWCDLKAQRALEIAQQENRDYEYGQLSGCNWHCLATLSDLVKCAFQPFLFGAESSTAAPVVSDGSRVRLAVMMFQIDLPGETGIAEEASVDSDDGKPIRHASVREAIVQRFHT